MISELNIDIDTATRMLEQARRDVDKVEGVLPPQEYMLRALTYAAIANATYTYHLVRNQETSLALWYGTGKKGGEPGLDHLIPDGTYIEPEGDNE